ncbi:MAG: serine hydrolase [Flavobacteriales bacterium]|nr:serine hydrolase [Flavobacteriales bacterium]MDG1779937.1 serine hydrolase [Flavobacteriales bacterium]
MALKLIALQALFFLSLSSFAQNLSEDLEAIYDDYNLMGISVITICGGEIDDVYHAGLKDYDNQLPIDDETKFRIASISKSITATGMMLLKSQLDFSFDDDISEHLGFLVRNPNFPNTPITIAHVLSHTSSIQDGDGYNGFLSATYSSSPDLPSLQGLLDEDGDYYTSNMFRTEEPGTYFAYSNLNYGLVATLIEAISGQRFDTYMDEQFFAPLQMDASYNVENLQDIANLAALYRNQGGWTAQVDNYQGEVPEPVDLSDYTPGSNGLRFAPQGGLRISTLELARLALLHMNEGYDTQTGTQLIPTETMQLMHTPVWTYNGSNGDNYYNLFNSWGLGIQAVTNTANGDIVFPESNLPFLGHPGEAYGLISDWYFDKDAQSGVIFLTNGSWDGFSFGDYSAFYTLEEEVFTAVEINLVCGENVNELNGKRTAVFPSPVMSGEPIYIRSQIATDKIELRDITGKTVHSSTLDEERIQLPELGPGLYTLTIFNADGITTERIVIQ